jgi:hypothetical protein
MCDGAAPGTRTGSARDIVPRSAPDRPRPRERARAVSSRRERAALPFALPHGDHWQDRPGPARARSWRVATTRRCSSRRCQAARSWERDRRSGASPPAPGVPRAWGWPAHRIGIPDEVHTRYSRSPQKSASGWHSTRTTVSPESKRPLPGTAWPRPRPGLSRDGTVAGALVPPVDVVAHARGCPWSPSQ